MADTLVQDTSVIGGNSKTFALTTTNTLFSQNPALNGIQLYGSTYGRPFVPTRVTLCYQDFTRVTVFTQTKSPTNSGSTTWYDSTKVPSGVKSYQIPKNMLPLSAMPSWLTTLMTPFL